MPLSSIIMAIGSTILTFTVQLADMDRGVYEELNLRVAKHPSETDQFLVTRLLAYCLEYEEGIEFGGGVSTAEDPAVLVRDLTGSMTAWIEVGAPDAARVHAGSKQAGRAVIYTHRDPKKLLTAWQGKQIYKAEEIALRSFDDGFVEKIAANVSRRNEVTLTVTEGQLYFSIGESSFESALHTHPILGE